MRQIGPRSSGWQNIDKNERPRGKRLRCEPTILRYFLVCDLGLQIGLISSFKDIHCNHTFKIPRTSL